MEEIVVIGSIAELEELTGEKVTDIHRHFIDHLTIPSRKGKGTLKRIDEVFDCWFESGSMPYAQQHYPFENKEVFENGFPAHFIAEGIDQVSQSVSQKVAVVVFRALGMTELCRRLECRGDSDFCKSCAQDNQQFPL